MEEKKKSKKGIIITILILVIIALAGVGGFFGYKIWKDSQTTGTEWGDTYLDNLENKISNGEYADTENSSFGFIQFEESKKPAMVLNYETETNKVMEISVLDSENNIKSKKYETEKENELNIEMLYDIESKEYNWYEHEKKQDGTEIFTEVAQNDIEQGTELTEDKIHEFTKEEMTEQEVAEGEIPSIPKFDEEFVKPDIEPDKTDIDLKNKDIDKKELKEKVENAVENYKPKEENITDEAKQNVDNSLKELETKKEEIKKAEEEKARKEEEARKAAEEEKKKGLKVGNYTLKYGTYKLATSYEGCYGTITLDLDGKCHIKSNIDYDLNNKTPIDEDATYKVESGIDTDGSGTRQDGIVFNIKGKRVIFVVFSNNAFSDQWHEYKLQ